MELLHSVEERRLVGLRGSVRLDNPSVSQVSRLKAMQDAVHLDTY